MSKILVTLFVDKTDLVLELSKLGHPIPDAIKNDLNYQIKHQAGTLLMVNPQTKNEYEFSLVRGDFIEKFLKKHKINHLNLTCIKAEENEQNLGSLKLTFVGVTLS